MSQRTFNWLWTAVASFLFLSMLSHFLVAKGMDAIGFSLAKQNAPLGAFWGMHVYAIAGTFLAILTALYARDMSAEPWPKRIPQFSNLEINAENSYGRLIQVGVFVAFLILPAVGQIYFLDFFHAKGSVYVYPKKFGFDKAELERYGACILDGEPRCLHPSAKRYTTLKGKNGESPYFDNAYHYGAASAKSDQKSVTFFPLAQPVIILILSGIAFLFTVLAAYRIWRR